MFAESLFWNFAAAVLIAAGVALQFANLYTDRLRKTERRGLLPALLSSRLFQLFGGLALITLGILALSQGAAAG